jgi:hypothetical protein
MKLAPIPTSGAAPNFDLLKDKTLTSIFFTFGTMPDDGKADEFYFLSENRIDPNKLAQEVMRNSPMPTFLNEDRITKMKFVEKDGILSGTVEFAVPSLYRGKVNFVAKKHDGDLDITEFSFPKHGIYIIRSSPDGLWKLKKQPASTGQ